MKHSLLVALFLLSCATTKKSIPPRAASDASRILLLNINNEQDVSQSKNYIKTRQKRIEEIAKQLKDTKPDLVFVTEMRGPCNEDRFVTLANGDLRILMRTFGMENKTSVFA